MSDQDDLDIKYKAASTEQPTAEIDQFILQAAADAANKSAESSKPSNIIKGKFNSRRWHTPVSLAAAAVITVSVVSSLKPWSLSVPEAPSAVPVPVISKEVVSADQIESAPTVVSDNFEEEQILVKSQALNKMETDQLLESKAKRVQAPKKRKAAALKQEFARDSKMDSSVSMESNTPEEDYISVEKFTAVGAVAALKDDIGTINAPTLAIGITYPSPKIIPDFQLVDHTEKLFTQQQLKGKWSIIFFGYTYCPDICPTTMMSLSQVAKKLQPSILEQTQFVFVSVDPERDTVEQLAQYMPFYHPDFIGVTGEATQLKILSHNLGGMAIKVPSENDTTDGSYLISHSGSLLIIDPKGRRYGIFPKTSSTFNIGSLTKDIEAIITNYQSNH